jgi:hypothetical protein
MAYFSFSSLNALPNIIADRAVYYYQRDTRYYSPLPYILSNILAEVNHQFPCVRECVFRQTSNSPFCSTDPDDSD